MPGWLENVWTDALSFREEETKGTKYPPESARVRKRESQEERKP